MSGKASAEEWKARHAWKQYLLTKWNPELPKGIDRSMALLVADIIEWSGTAGRGCYISNVGVADIIGRSRYTVKRYRAFLVRSGLFGETGARRNQINVLDIAMPVEATAAGIEHRQRPAQEAVTSKRSDRETTEIQHEDIGTLPPPRCPACKARFDVLDASMSREEYASAVDEIRAGHAKAMHADVRQAA